MKTKKFTFSGILLSTAERCSMLGRDSWVSDLRTYANNILIERRVKLTGPETHDRIWDRWEKRTTENHQFSWFCSKTLGDNGRGDLGLAQSLIQGKPRWKVPGGGLEDVSEKDGAWDGAALSHVTQNIAVRRGGGGGGRMTLQR